MRKSIIYAAGNENLGDFNISYYIIKKSPSFFDWFSELLISLSFNVKEKIEIKHWVKDLKDKEGFVIDKEIYVKEIDKMIDVHENYSSGGNRIDLFYGKDRIYMTFWKSKESRRILSEFLKKNSEWITIDEVDKNEMPIYAGKKVDYPN